MQVIVTFTDSAERRKSDPFVFCSFETRLPQVMRDLHACHQAISSRLRAEQFKQKVLACFRAWDDWAIYPDMLLIHLQNTFLGLVGDVDTKEPQEVEVSFVESFNFLLMRNRLSVSPNLVLQSDIAAKAREIVVNTFLWTTTLTSEVRTHNREIISAMKPRSSSIFRAAFRKRYVVLWFYACFCC